MLKLSEFIKKSNSTGLPNRSCFAAKAGGEREIRTPDTVSGMTVFKTVAFNRSAKSPYNFFMSVGKLLTHPAYDPALVSALFLWEAQEELRSCGLQALC